MSSVLTDDAIKLLTLGEALERLYMNVLLRYMTFYRRLIYRPTKSIPYFSKRTNPALTVYKL
jgi:hypothetical protein